MNILHIFILILYQEHKVNKQLYKDRFVFIWIFIGKGYGTKMIHHIENELKQRGSKGVHLGNR